MRLLFAFVCLFGLVATACAAQSGDEVLRAKPYCFGPAQQRSAYLTANRQGIVAQVREGRVVLVNQAEPGVVRVAREAGDAACGSGEDRVTLGELAAQLEQWPSNERLHCRLTGLAPEHDPLGFELPEHLALMGVASGVTMVGSDLTLETVEQCAVIEPIVRDIAPNIEWTAVAEVRAQ